ncbi:hypothetical protein LINPERHAP2_LOCUS30059 [Linum perenne]
MSNNSTISTNSLRMRVDQSATWRNSRESPSRSPSFTMFVP